MDIYLTLFRFDSLLLKRYLSKDTLAKLLVMAAYISLVLGVVWVTYSISHIFFLSLSGFEEYGTLTARYLMHASIILILIFGTGSSLVSGLGFNNMDRGALGQLMILPIRPIQLSVWRLTKTIISNVLVLLFIGLPVFAAYGQIFAGDNWMAIIFRGLIVLISVSILTSCIGAILSMIIPRNYSKFGGLLSVIFFIFFFISLIVIIKAIFPPQIGRLSLASPSEFNSIYGGLPLNRSFMPTTILVSAVIDSQIFPVIWVMTLVLGFLIITISYISKRLITQYQESAGVYEHHLSGLSTKYPLFRLIKEPLIALHLFPIMRLTTERNYMLFLGFVAVFFFLMLGIGLGSGNRVLSYQKEILIFTSAWILFFQTAFALRLFYPIGGRIMQNKWHLFTLPIKRKRIIRSVVTAILIAYLPSIIVTKILWLTFPSAGNYSMILMVMTLLGIMGISLVSGLVGLIHPDRESARNPEAATTSGLGLLALALSTIFGGIIIMSILQILNNTLPVLPIIILSFSVLLVIIISLYSITIRTLGRIDI